MQQHPKCNFPRYFPTLNWLMTIISLQKILFNWILNVITWTIIYEKKIKRFTKSFILIRSVTKLCNIFFYSQQKCDLCVFSVTFKTILQFLFWGIKINQDFIFTSEWYWFYYYLRMDLFQLTICCIDTFFIWIWRVVPFYAKIAVAPGSAIFFKQRRKVFCSWAPATTSWFKTLTGSTR